MLSRECDCEEFLSPNFEVLRPTRVAEATPAQPELEGAEVDEASEDDSSAVVVSALSATGGHTSGAARIRCGEVRTHERAACLKKRNGAPKALPPQCPGWQDIIIAIGRFLRSAQQWRRRRLNNYTNTL